jgi:DNA mismatch repair protein MutS2
MGVPGSSHAFDIAERYGLRHGLIERARELRGDEGAKLDELVSSLEELQRDAQERKRESERELGASRIARTQYERKLAEIEDIRATAKNKATKEAEEILGRANTFIERAVREAKEAATKESTAAAQQEELRALRARQERERKELLKATEAAKPKPKIEKSELTLEVGSKVKLRSNPGQVGSVISLKGNDVEIEMGALRMRTKPDQLEVVSSSDARSKQRIDTKEVTQATKYLAETMEPRVDLRGQYGDDAVMHVDSFLADAAAHGLARVEIIHGIGTGALAKRINQHMKGHPFVATYRYGEPQEGGAGVTIVELK